MRINILRKVRILAACMPNQAAPDSLVDDLRPDGFYTRTFYQPTAGLGGDDELAGPMTETTTDPR